MHKATANSCLARPRSRGCSQSAASMTCHDAERTRAAGLPLASRPCAGRSFLAGAFAVAAKEGALQAVYRSCLLLPAFVPSVRPCSPNCWLADYYDDHYHYCALFLDDARPAQCLSTCPRPHTRTPACLPRLPPDAATRPQSTTYHKANLHRFPLQIRHYSVVRGCFLAPTGELLRCLIASAQVR